MASRLGTTTASDIVNSLQAMSTPFKSDSKAVSSSVKVVKDVQKVVKSEITTPLQDMTRFFARIGKGIETLIQKTGEATGITKLMASIMGKDLSLSEKEANLQKIKDRGVNINKAKTKDQEEETKGPGMLDSLKAQFAKLGDNQTVGELGKIFLIAAGLFAFSKIAGKLNKVIAPIIKFFAEDLIPSFKELNTDILKSSTGYLGIGGLISKSFYTFGLRATKFFAGVTANTARYFADLFKIKITMPKGLTGISTKLGALTAEGSFLGKIGSMISSLTKSFTTAASGFAKLPGIAQVLGFGSKIIRFAGPIGLFIQGVIGLFSGISEAVKVFKAGGNIFDVIGAFVTGVFDAIVGATLNLLADITGWVLKKVGLVSLGEFIQDLDFSISGLIDMGKAIWNNFKKMINTFIGAANDLIPFGDPIPYISVDGKTSAEIKVDRNEAIKESEVKDAINATGKYQSLDEGFDSAFDDNIKSNVSNTYTDKIMLTNNMKEKTTTLNAVAAASKTNTAGSSNINVVKGGNTSNSTINQTAVQTADISISHSDPTGELFSMAGS